MKRREGEPERGGVGGGRGGKRGWGSICVVDFLNLPPL
jgi:hypothetical protein